MEQTSEPGYGQVVSPDGAAWTAVSGEPDGEHTGPSNRDDAGSQEQAGSGSLEEQARSLLEGCEGMEPPYEWMSVEGSPDRTEHELTAGHSTRTEGEYRSVPRDHDSALQRPHGPMLNGVGPAASGPQDRGEHSGRAVGRVESEETPMGSLQSERFEDLIRQLVQQNQALQNELAWVRQASGRTSCSESDGVGLYRGQSSDRRISEEPAELGEGRGSRSVRVPGRGGSERGKGIGVPKPESAGWKHVDLSERVFQPPWTHFGSFSGESAPAREVESPWDPREIAPSERSQVPPGQVHYGLSQVPSGPQVPPSQVHNGLSQVPRPPGGSKK